MVTVVIHAWPLGVLTVLAGRQEHGDRPGLGRRCGRRLHGLCARPSPCHLLHCYEAAAGSCGGAVPLTPSPPRPARAAPLSQQPPHRLAPLLLPFTLTSALRTHDIRTHDIVFVDYAHIITTQLIENTKKVGSGSKKSRLGSVDDLAMSRSNSKRQVASTMGDQRHVASTMGERTRRNEVTMDGGMERFPSKPPPQSMGLNGRPPSREV